MLSRYLKHIKRNGDFFVGVTLVLLYAFTAFAGDRVTKDKVAGELGVMDAEKVVKVWIYFTDKGEAEGVTAGGERERREKVERGFCIKKVERLGKLGNTRQHADWSDIPLCKKYVDEIISFGVKKRQVSKWLNAMSGEVKVSKLEKIAECGFVKSIERVKGYRFKRPEWKEAGSGGGGGGHQVVAGSESKAGGKLAYGNSLPQLEFIKIPGLHNKGYRGKNTVIAIFDTGFDREHESLENVDIVDEYDFINNDKYVGYDSSVVECTSGDYACRNGQLSHGTAVFSIIGGDMADKLIGAAPDAGFLLAKTENNFSETPVEEDNWAAAAEWADSLGADVISSSVGYRDYEDTNFTHGYEELDGKSTVVTRAANVAGRKGILVFTAMGNEGHEGVGTLVAPADGDTGVSAVGACYASGNIADFSSAGPTYDGRIKPDLLALGSGVYAANWGGKDQYYSAFSGTSAATPFAAGAGALLLQFYESKNPLEVLAIMKNTASRADVVGSEPGKDNIYGWGIINAFKAAGFSDTATTEPGTTRFDKVYPNPSTSGVFYFDFTLSKDQEVSFHLFNAAGEEVRTISFPRLVKEEYKGKNDDRFKWDGKNGEGEEVGNGIYMCVMRTGSESYVKQIALVR